MKKVRLLHSHGYRDIKSYWWEKPDPGPQEIEVKPRMVGICRSDIAMFQGHFSLPFGMFGHEGLAEVTQVGSQVTNYKVGDIVATRGDPAYADFYNCKLNEVVKVPEVHPRYILEPVACALNISFGLSKQSNYHDPDKILILGSGFLSIVVQEHLEYIHPNTKFDVVGRANKDHWVTKDIKLKDINDLTDTYQFVVDLSEKSEYVGHDCIGENAVVMMAAEKKPPVHTTFSNPLWKNQTWVFPSPRNPDFHHKMNYAKKFAQEKPHIIDRLWTKSYDRETEFEQAFVDGSHRGKDYSRGYLVWSKWNVSK